MGAIEAYKKMVSDEALEEKKKLDPVNDKENDKKFKDRKDKDIDNDGDVDSSDEYLHKRRKATDDAIDDRKKKSEQYDAKDDHTMDPTSHVKKDKDSGMYCVYNMKGKKIAEFKTKAEADAYAKKNHDDLMKEYEESTTKKKSEKTEKELEDEDEDPVMTDKEPKSNSDMKKNPKTADKKAEISKIKESFDAMWEQIEEALGKKIPDSAAKPEEMMSKSSPKSKEFAKQHDADNPEVVADAEKAAETAVKAGKGGPSKKKRPGDNPAGDMLSLIHI